MPGRVKELIDELCQLRSRGNAGVEHFVRANLVLHGIDPSDYHADSPDEFETETSLRDMIRGFHRSKGKRLQ